MEKVLNYIKSMRRIKPLIKKRHTPAIINTEQSGNFQTKISKINKKTNISSNLPKRKSDIITIVAGGPSVLKIDLNNLEGDILAVNRAIEYVKKPTYFLSMDYTFIDKKVKEYELDKAIHKVFILNREHPYIKEKNGVYYDSRIGLIYSKIANFDYVIPSYDTINKSSGFGLEIENFAHGNNSGFSAIQFAILMGYSKINVIGIDLNFNGSKTHFHKGYGENPGRFSKKIFIYLTNFRNAFKLLPDNIKNKFNILSKTSLLNNMVSNNIINIEEEPTNKKLEDLMVVGYYTIGTPYEQEAIKTINSCKRLGLNYDIIGVPNLGSWQANTRYKAKFMLDMLKKHTNMRLFYIDVDAVFNDWPKLFETLNCDIAVRWQDFRWRKNECLSGSIYMENNELTRELCLIWDKYNEKIKTKGVDYEQWNLGNAILELRRKGLNDKLLPPEYCQFDLIEQIYPNLKKGKGIVQHYQASRKFKNKIK